jgi:hypothetical protein
MLPSACRAHAPWPARYSRCAVQFCANPVTQRSREDESPRLLQKRTSEVVGRSIAKLTMRSSPPRIRPWYLRPSLVQQRNSQCAVVGGQRAFFTDNGPPHDGHGHSHGSIQDLPKDAKARRIIWIGLWSNVGLTLAKGGIGIAANSTSLVADAIHSASDLVSDCVALVAIKVAHRPRDESQPYGYGHYESLGTLSVSALLIVAGLAAGNHALEHMYPLLDPGAGT